MGRKASKPGWDFELGARARGFTRIAGIDEAGRGPLAGPVVAAAVIFPPGLRLEGLDDSKRLSPKQRSELARIIRREALAVGVGIASAEEIDRLNILAATHLAARRAVESLAERPDYFLTDYLRLDWAEAPVEPLAGGDGRCASIAAASIIAKVARDEMMCAYDREFPGYGFASHKGYASRAHLDALRRLGPTTIHRTTFRGVSWFASPLRHSLTFERLREAIEAVDSPQAARNVRAAVERVRELLPPRERSEIERLLSQCLEKAGFRTL